MAKKIHKSFKDGPTGLFLNTRTAYGRYQSISNFLFRFPSFAETKAQIRGPSEYIHSSSTLKLSCRVYLGPRGPDEDYARTAVIHWFHEQRLLGMYNFIKTCLQFKFKIFLGQKM